MASDKDNTPLPPDPGHDHEAPDASDGGEREPEGETGPEPRAARPRIRRAPGGGKARSRAVASVDDLDRLDDLADAELADLPDPPPSVLRRLPWWAVAGAVLLALAVALVLWGEVNSQRFFLVCKGSSAEAHQGRSFPWPFGHSALGGPLYRPVPLHVETQCEPQELDSEDQLQQSLLALLHAELERRRGVTKLGELRKTRSLLTQGFGLARADKTWVGRLRTLQAHFDLKEAILLLREMESALVEARRLLLRARHPRDAAKAGTAEDPESWITLVDHVLDRLRAGRAPAAPREAIPVPVPVPSGDATTQGGAPTPRASPPGPTPPPLPLLQDPPQPAIPLLPDAGVKGGGILL